MKVFSKVLDSKQKENFPVMNYDTKPKQCTVTRGIPPNYHTFAACLNPPKPGNLMTLSIAGVLFSEVNRFKW